MPSVCSEITWFYGLLDELDFSQLHLTPFYANNTRAIQIEPNPVFHEHMKHIEVDYRSIHESFDKHVILFLAFPLNIKMQTYSLKFFLDTGISFWLTN